ncbi:MAG: hypothetical protein IT559_02015 [Alphaproteobacteria bacterium]|nr:hypothetical protein [Alphaproteobacteria bacterium]
MRKLFYVLSLFLLSSLTVPADALAETAMHDAHHQAAKSQTAEHHPGKMSMPMSMAEPEEGVKSCSSCKKMCSGMKEEMMKDKMKEKMGGMQCKKMENAESKCGCCKKMMGSTKQAPKYDHNDSSHYNQ